MAIFVFSACSSDATKALTESSSGTNVSDAPKVSDEETPERDTDPENEVPEKELSREDIYLNAINKVRASSQDCGVYGMKPVVDPLIWNENLANAAHEHSNDMVETNTFSHAGSGTEYDLTAIFYDLEEGSSVVQRADYNNYGSSYVGENIAAGYENVDTVVSAWLNSDGHCKNIMSDEYTEMGMALVEKAGTQYSTYWTLNFGKK